MADSIERVQPATTYSITQIELIKRTICKGATDDELDLFVATCHRLRLDPFAKQIYAVKRWDSKAKCEIMQTIVGIDGLRLTAERTGLYDGQQPPLWCGPDMKWLDVWINKTPPAAALVGVYRQGAREPFKSPAVWTSFAQLGKDGKPYATWAKMPDIMLAKCAEAQALRKAFPAQLGNLYAPEELDQMDSAPAPAYSSGKAKADPVTGEVAGEPDKFAYVARLIDESTTMDQMDEAASVAAQLPRGDKRNALAALSQAKRKEIQEGAANVPA